MESVVQTFLPFPDFEASARCLDTKRLGKQRVECLQLLRGQWSRHPASRMWRGHEYWLGRYAAAVCEEWRRRGYRDSCLEKVMSEQRKFDDTGPPPWLGDEAFHRAHRSKLKSKNPNHYESLEAPEGLEYVWPKGKEDE